LYFLNQNIRQDLGLDKESLFLTALQKTFSVMAAKGRMEKVHGAMSNSFCNIYDDGFHVLKNPMVLGFDCLLFCFIPKLLLVHPFHAKLVPSVDVKKTDPSILNYELRYGRILQEVC
jgi:hypothetical protein